LAGRLVQSGVTPNGISVASTVFASAGAAALLWVGENTGAVASAGYVFAALMIQGRLLCNLFDGMVAVEGGKKTVTGEIYNELPDRISDTVLFLGAGYGCGHPWGPTLGLLAALFAIATAYVRLLGVSAGAPHDFTGPMAKQHRMAILTLACLGNAALVPFQTTSQVSSSLMVVALALIGAGALVTAIRRNRRIVRQLRSKT
jgi:phosphatidylglycerophosphate synthase